MSLLSDMLKTLSRGEGKSIEQEFNLIGNCFGFLSIKGGVGTSTLINELATITSSEGIHTCIVDCSPLSSFYVSKYLDTIERSEEIPSIGKRFEKQSCPITDCLININSKLKLLTFGDLPISNSFDMGKSVIKNTLEELKSVFDLVLLDIPNLPYIEFTLEALLCSSTVYSVLGYNYDSVYMYQKTRTLLTFAGLQHKIGNLIICGSPRASSLKGIIEDALENTKVLCEIPEVPKLKRTALDYESVLNNMSGSEIKSYASCLAYLFNEITTGISGKSIHNEEEVK